MRVLQQHGLLYNQMQRVFYRGHMFRYERPQKGRYRQFYQLGAEAFGMAGPDVDAELLALSQTCWQRLGIERSVRLELNTIGSAEDRLRYREALVGYLSKYVDDLDEDSRRRLATNPLRILDSKVDRTREILAQAPVLTDEVGSEGRAHFDGLCAMLEDLGIDYVLNPRLVRGLDYYNFTVFEWVTDDLGAQGTICAGGRYDTLVEQLGGRPTPGAGFALGLERVLLLYEQRNLPTRGAVDVYVCVLSDDRYTAALDLAGRLRTAMPQLRIRVHAGGGKLKNQLKKADQCGAGWSLLVGGDEGPVLKAMATGEQTVLGAESLVDRIRNATQHAGS